MLGDPIIDKDVVKKMLEVVPKYLEQVAISIETLLDLATVSIEEVTGRLRAVEQRKKPASSEAKDSSGRLLLTEEDWLARYKAREQEKKGGSSGGNGGGGRNRRRGRGKGRGGGELNRTDTSGQDGQGNTCRNCGKAGHWARDCISKPMKSGEAHLAQEEEATLLLGEVCTISLTPSSVSPPTSPPPPLYRASAPPADSTSLPHRAPTPLTDSLVREPILPPVPSQVREKIHLVEEKVHAQLYNEEQKDDRRWVVDTGATNHMSGAQSAFSNLDSTVSGSVKFGDGSVVRIEGRGTVIFDCKNGEHRFFTDVYFIPKLQTNIISVGQLDEIGGEALVRGGFLRMRDEDGRLLAKIPCTPSRLYVLDLTISWAGCFAARGAENAWRWHDRFGHLNFPALRKMAREGMVRGLPELEQTDQLCEGCLAGKQRRTPFPEQGQLRAERALELVHGDLCGPITPATPGGKKYFLLLVDVFSRYMWVELLPSKDCAPAAIKRIRVVAETQSRHKLSSLRTDRGGEFTSADFTDHLVSTGVRRQLTAPYSPQ